MRGHSNDLAATVQNSHIAVSRVDVIRDGKVVRQLDVHSGTVTSDATAAQRTTIEVDVSDPDGDLTPSDMESLLAPFGTRIQVSRGARLEDVDLRVATNGVAQGWAVSGLSTGILNGLCDDGTGLVLGPPEHLYPDTPLYPSPTLYPH
jgi:hypothetical protein